MKKIIALLMTAMMLTAVSGCGDDEISADSYADKLAKGEIKPEVEVSSDGAPERTEKKNKKKTDKTEVEQKAEPGTENQLPSQAQPDIPQSEASPVKLALSEADMGAMIDKFDDEYKSFEVVSAKSPDFFMGKNLRLGAVISDHQLSQVYSQNIRAAFSPQKMSVSSVDATGQEVGGDYYIYSVAGNVAKTPSGRDFTYVSYGSNAPDSGEINGVIGVIARVVCSKPEAMGDAQSDEYILLIESGQPEVYQLFLAE